MDAKTEKSGECDFRSGAAVKERDKTSQGEACTKPKRSMDLSDQLRAEFEQDDAPASLLVLHTSAMTAESARMVLESGELLHTRLYAWAPKMKLVTRVEARAEVASATLLVSPAGVDAFESTSAITGESAKHAIRVQAAASYAALDLLVEGGDGNASIEVVFV